MAEVWAIISPQAQRSIVGSENPPIPQNRSQSRRTGTQAGQEPALKELSDPYPEEEKRKKKRVSWGGGLLIKDECKDAIFGPTSMFP